MIRTVVLSNPRRTDLERKPSSRQVQAMSAMRPDRDLARYDVEQAGHAAYMSGQHARLDAKTATALATLEALAPMVRAMAAKTAKKFHRAAISEMIYNAHLHDAAPDTYFDDRLITDYLLAIAAGDTHTSAALKPHVIGLFRDARQEAKVDERYPSLTHHPHLLNPKEQFRSRRAAKRGARGAAATQEALNVHYEKVSHDLADDREEKMLDDHYRRTARTLGDDRERDY